MDQTQYLLKKTYDLKLNDICILNTGFSSSVESKAEWQDIPVRTEPWVPGNTLKTLTNKGIGWSL